ncbi:MAG: RraA family protein [Acidimicrobiia bacterium]|nr:RraA family protein [Acidimicrobiia bacterium]
METDQEQLDRAAELGSSLLSDALDALGHRHQCLGWDIGPVGAAGSGVAVAGRALPLAVDTVDAPAEVPYTGLLAALDAVGPGDIVVIPTGRDVATAVWGELLSTASRARGAAGIVTDGMVRDVRQVDRLEFPVFARGTVPTDINGRLEIVGHGVAAHIDDVPISPGDMVIADGDGVVVVPADLAGAAVAHAYRKSSDEQSFRLAVESGMLPSEAYRKYRVL